MTVRRPPGGRAAALALRVLVVAGLLLGAEAGTASAAPAGPTAVDDTATVPVGQAVRLAGATNDHAGSAAIQPGLTVFPADGQPTGSSVSDGGRTLQVAKHGTFTVNTGDGSVDFHAWSGFTGDVAVRYRITDAVGATDDGLLSVEVTANGTRDYVLADFGTEIPVTDVLANDVPGRNADGTPGTLDRGSVRFDPEEIWGAVVSDDGRKATITALGTSIPIGVATLDDRGLVTWRAYPSSSDWGIWGPVDYIARDTTVAADGTVEHHSYTTELDLAGNPNTNPYRVRTTDDHAATPFNASVTVPVLANDHPYSATATLRPELTVFEVGDLGRDDFLSPDRRKIRYPGRGTWIINTDGTVTYIPPRGFVGKDAVELRVTDDSQEDGLEELVVTVEPGPTAKADTATTAQGTTTSVAVLGNDTPGKDADGTAGSMDATFVRFPTDGQPTDATVSAYQRTLTVPGEGVYTADRVSGEVRFTPSPGFTGTASPVTYSARDTVTRTDGRTVHNPVTASLTVTVSAVTPVALDNWVSTVAGTPVEIPVLGNDKPGSASAPLAPSSLRLRLAPGLPDGSRLSGDAKTLVVAGDGTFVARTDGVLVFTPVTGFVGTVPAIGYQVADANGTTARASITVQVRKSAG